MKGNMVGIFGDNQIWLSLLKIQIKMELVGCSTHYP
jgi:hypothetical protein